MTRKIIDKIISGGQTGVDRAALDAAIHMQIPNGGWCPKGRKAEDGAIPPYYNLQETSSSNYKQRTKWNVRDSDGTLIIATRELTGGTAFTLEKAQQLGKPYLIIKPQETALRQTNDWLQANKINILNIAGPRESTEPGIYQQAFIFLQILFAPNANNIDCS